MNQNNKNLNINSINLSRLFLSIVPFIFSILYLTGPLLTIQYQDKYPQLRFALIVFTIFFGLISIFNVNLRKVEFIKISKVTNINIKVYLLTFLSIIFLILYVRQYGEAESLGGIKARELNTYANSNLFVLLRYLFLALITCNCILVLEKKIYSSLYFVALFPGFMAIVTDLLILGTRRTSLFIILIYIYLLSAKLKPKYIIYSSIPLLFIGVFSFLISGLRVYVDFVERSLLEIVINDPVEAFNFSKDAIFSNAGNSEFGLVGASLAQYIDYTKSIEANYFVDLMSNFLTILPNQISPIDLNLPSQNVDALFPFYFGEMFIYFGNLSLIISPLLILVTFIFALTRKIINPISLFIIGSSADFLRTNMVEFFLGFLVFFISYKLLNLIINTPEVFIFYERINKYRV